MEAVFTVTREYKANPMTVIPNIVISGPGLIGAQHARLIKERQDCKLAAVVLPDTTKHKEVGREFGCSVYSSLDAAFQSGKCDAVIISSPNEFHYDQALQCISNSIPVLIEKPITDSLATARSLVEVSQRYKSKVLVGHHRTYSPLLEAASSFVRSEKFGKLVSVYGAALFFKPDTYFAAGPWRAKIGGGPLLINMVHEIGIMRYLCGEIQSVSAMASRRTRKFEVEDTVAINLEFANGALGTFILSDAAASNKSWEMTSGENKSYPYYPEDACYHFSGSNGSLDFPVMKARFYDTDAPSWWAPFNDIMLDAKRADPLRRQIDHFVDVIRGTAKPVVTAFDGYANILVIDAIQRSIANRSVEAVVFDANP